MNYETKFYLLSFVFDPLNKLFPSQPHYRLAEKLPARIADGSTILDLCTGTGYGARIIAKQHPNCEVTGIDLSTDMLQAGQNVIDKEQLANLRLIHADASALPFEDSSFDIITVTFGLHELPTAVREKALSECHRILKQKGQLIIADLDKPEAWYGGAMSGYFAIAEPAHARGIIKNTLDALLRRSGFSVVTRSYGLKGFIQYVTAVRS